MIATEPTKQASQLGGAFLPDENARRLSVLQYVETVTMRTMAGWIARVPELDVKIELARQVAFAAERADALGKRVAQLLWPDERDVLLHPQVVQLLRDVDESHDTVSLVAGLGAVVLPNLGRAYQAHAAATDPITDAPTVRLLKRLEDDVRAAGEWFSQGAATLVEDPLAVPGVQRSLVDRFAKAGGAWFGRPPGDAGVSLHGELRRGPAGTGARVDGLARDARFRD
ncbi:MAG: hypothetical protein ACRDJN_24685, partial [Chloroflexota bacterium]